MSAKGTQLQPTPSLTVHAMTAMLYGRDQSQVQRTQDEIDYLGKAPTFRMDTQQSKDAINIVKNFNTIMALQGHPCGVAVALSNYMDNLTALQ